MVSGNTKWLAVLLDPSFVATSGKVGHLIISILDDSEMLPFRLCYVTLEPQPGSSSRRFSMRVLQVVEPIEHANTGADSTKRTVTEGSLLRSSSTGKLLTFKIDKLKQRRDISLLWPDPPCVVSFFLPFCVF